MRFLLIKDNQALANAVIERLSLDSHIVDHAADLTTVWDYTATADYFIGYYAARWGWAQLFGTA